MADALMGRVNPSGRLPFVVPTVPAQLPYFDQGATSIVYDLWHGYRKLDRDGHAPAFPTVLACPTRRLPVTTSR